MVEGGMKIVKYLLFLFNVLFTLVGIALIGVGAYVQTQLKDVAAIFGSEFYGPGILLIVVGVVIFVIAFLGCCGAIKENYCCIMTFSVLLTVIFILMIAAGVAGYVFRDKIETKVVEKMKVTEAKINSTDVNKAWEFIQQSFKCCGVDSLDEWEEYLPEPPESCCKEMDSSACAARSFDDTSALYTKSCKDGVVSWMKSKVAIIGGTGIGLAFVVVLGIILACCLARSVKNKSGD